MNKRYVTKQFISDLLKKTPEVAATLSKLVEDPEESNVEQKYGHKELDTAYFKPVKDFGKRYQDSIDALKLFQDLKLASEIYSSLVISSGDLATTQINIGSSHQLIPPDLKAKILKFVKTEITENYDLTDELDRIMNEMLVGKGAVCRVTLPENTLDDIINGKSATRSGLESDSELFLGGEIRPLGLLGDLSGNSISLEDGSTILFEANEVKKRIKNGCTIPSIEIIDNFNVLKLSEVNRALEEQQVRSSIYGDFTPNEGLYRKSDTGEDEDVEDGSSSLRVNEIFKEVTKATGDVLYVHQSEFASRESISRPLRFEVPPECMITVIVPGMPHKAKGYYLMLDGNNNFLTLESSITDKEKNAAAAVDCGKEDSETKKNMSGFLKGGSKEKDKQISSGDIAFKRFKEVINRDMVDRLQSGFMAGSSFEVSENRDIEYIMFLRTLTGRKTKLLFIPENLLTHYTLKVDDKGIGINALEDMCEINMMRGTLLFSDVLATVKNNLRTTNVELSLEPGDPDPAKTIAIATAEVMKTREMDLPLNTASISQLGDWVQRAGFSFSFTNHPGLPQVGFKFSDGTVERSVQGDSKLMEQLRNQQFNAFGLTPEVVDTGLDVNFATTDQANRKFLLKRIRKTRRMLSKHLTKEYVNIIRCDPFMYKSIIEALEPALEKGEKDKKRALLELFNAFLLTVEVTLPNNEEDNNLKSAKENYELYEQALEKALDAWLSNDMFDRDGFTNDIATYLEMLKAQLRGHYLREYQNANGYFTELGDITTIDSMGISYLKLGEAIPEHIIGVLRTAEDLVKGVKVSKKRTQVLLDKIQQYMDEEESKDENPEDADATDAEGDGEVTDDEGTGDEGTDAEGETDDEAADDEATDAEEVDPDEDTKEEKEKDKEEDEGPLDTTGL